MKEFLKLTWAAFKEHFYGIWLRVEDDFLTGIEKMKAAWYGFQSLWDEEGANAGLAKLNSQAEKRKAKDCRI